MSRLRSLDPSLRNQTGKRESAFYREEVSSNPLDFLLNPRYCPTDVMGGEMRAIRSGRTFR